MAAPRDSGCPTRSIDSGTEGSAAPRHGDGQVRVRSAAASSSTDAIRRVAHCVGEPALVTDENALGAAF